jgi:hypothetical protein
MRKLDLHDGNTLSHHTGFDTQWRIKMKVLELINYLIDNYKPDDAIVVAWWDRDHFDTADMTHEQWVDAADHLENMEWSSTYDRLLYALNDYMERSP